MPTNGSSTATLPRFDATLAPAHPELHAKHQTLPNVLDPSYWTQLNPGLHVGDAAFISTCKPIKPPKGRVKDLKQQINHAGVAQVAPEELPWAVDLDALADAAVNLVRHGWPPSMLVVYDEVWAMVQQASSVMKSATGGNACNMDILAWLVDPNQGGVGFSPHRDRQPDDSPATFRPDGSAMYATMWVPLTPATPENSCLYVIPRFADPGYYEGDPEEEGAPDPLAAALPTKESYQHIRALPAQPGAALLFTHRTIHWGSKGRPGYPTPRISISWGCADDAYEPPYFSRAHLPCPPLGLRLGLVGAQMIIYHERFPAPPKQLRLYYEAFTAQAANFDGTYRAKVKREFVDASKEATATAAAATVAAAAAAAAAGVNGAVAAAVGGKPSSKAGVAGVGDSDSDSKTKKKSKKAAQQHAAAAAAGANVDGTAAVAAGKQAKKQQSDLQPVEQQEHQQHQQPKPSRKRSKDKPSTPEATAAAAAAEGKKSKKRQKKQQQGQDAVAAAIAAAGAASLAAVTAAAAALAPAAAGAHEEEEDDSSDDGVGIDWAVLAAQAKAHKAKAKAGKKGAAAAAGAASKGTKAGKPGLAGLLGAAATAATADSEDEDDVMDLALEAMLDGDGDFAADYEDD